MSDRQRLRATFDGAAELYQEARPDYPDELYAALVRAADVRKGDRVLEIGCATGKATIPLARRGLHITAVEPGASLVELARHNLAEFQNAQVFQGDFESALVQEFDWEVSYDAEGYLRLLETFSGHIVMEPWQRERLHSEIRRRLAQRPDGRLRRGWGAMLHVARAL